MGWLKRVRGKAGIVLAGVLLLLVLEVALLMVWIPVSVADAQERAPGPATPGTGTVQTTPAVNPTITAETANEQLRKLQRDNERSFNAWFWSSGATFLSTLVLVFGGLFGFWRWRVDRRDAHDKELESRRDAQDKDLKDKAEERFKTAVAALGDEKEGVQLGGAILLRSFLNKDDKKIYGRYYTQTFDLAVAHLRLPGTPPSSEDPDGISQSVVDPTTPLPLTTLRQALIMVFKEAFPLARSQIKKSPELDASHVQLDNAFLEGADLYQMRLPEASLRNTNLFRANLRQANLNEADLSETYLYGADLSWADLSEANLSGANLRSANLSEANLSGANLRSANLYRADLSRADLSGTDLSGADLSGADLYRADLSRANLSEANLRSANLRSANLSNAQLSSAQMSWANLSSAHLSEADLSNAQLSGADLSGADLSGAQFSGADLSGVQYLKNTQSLKGTILGGVTGLTKEQLEACKAKGAIIDEDTTLSPPQLPISPPAPSQSKSAQVPSAPPAQANTPPPGTDGDSTPSSQQAPEL